MKQPRVLMISGSVDGLYDGVSHNTQHLLDHLSITQTQWNWWWLGRRRNWHRPPLQLHKGYKAICPFHGWTQRGIQRAIEVLQFLKPDLIHIQDQIHSFYETNAAVQIAQAAQVPVVTTLHEFHTELASIKYSKELVNLSQIVIANDSRNAQRCEQETGRKPDHILWSGANVLPLKTSLQVRPFEVCTFGQINALKNFKDVFAALKKVKDIYPKLRWNIIGPFDPENNTTHAQLARELSANWVHFIGGFKDINSKELKAYLGQCHFFVLPFADGASMRRSSLQTAWAFQKPIVTSAPTVAELIISDQKNCLLVDDKRTWSQAILTLLKSKELFEDLTKGSAETAQQMSWSNLAQKHIKIYSNVPGSF